MTPEERRFFLAVWRALAAQVGTSSVAAVAGAQERLGVDLRQALEWLRGWELRGWWMRPERLSLLREGCFTTKAPGVVAYQAAVLAKEMEEDRAERQEPKAGPDDASARGDRPGGKGPRGAGPRGSQGSAADVPPAW